MSPKSALLYKNVIITPHPSGPLGYYPPLGSFDAALGPRPTVYGPRAAQEGLRACKSLIALAGV